MTRTKSLKYLYLFLFLTSLLPCWMSVYIPPNFDLNYINTDQHSTNRITNPAHRHDNNNISKSGIKTWRTFDNDQEISHYLKLFNKKILVWTCKNVVEREWNVPMTPPHLDLYCNVIGHIGSITWYHGYRAIFSKTDVAKVHNHLDHRKRYTQVISPHVIKNGQHLYRQWTDVRLRIHNVTSKDSGLYSFRVTNKGKKQADSQQLFVYVARKTPESIAKHRRRKSNKTKDRVKKSKGKNKDGEKQKTKPKIKKNL